MTEATFCLSAFGKISNTFFKRQSPIIFSILKAYKDTKFWAKTLIKWALIIRGFTMLKLYRMQLNLNKTWGINWGIICLLLSAWNKERR